MRKVLIIEDRRENIVFIANNILKPLGYEVITAMDGQTGLAKAQEEAPDLIISDLKLPGLGGLEILEQLRQQDINIPTIMMTFHGSEETAVQALRLGACDYLIKPFTIEEMQAALKRAMRWMPPPPLKRLTTAPLSLPKENSAEQARITKLEQENGQLKTALLTRERQLGQMQQLLAHREKQPDSTPAGTAPLQAPPESGDGQVAQLQQELLQIRNVLATRERQLVQLQQQLTNTVKKVELAEVAQRPASWEEDYARLNQVLAQTKQVLERTEKRANTLEEVVVTQKIQMGKYQEEAKRLADQLRNLSEAVRLLSQDLGQQVERLGTISPRDKKR
jgi:DNA-binding response OmpR family regulator